MTILTQIMFLRNYNSFQWSTLKCRANYKKSRSPISIAALHFQNSTTEPAGLPEATTVPGTAGITSPLPAYLVFD